MSAENGNTAAPGPVMPRPRPLSVQIAQVPGGPQDRPWVVLRVDSELGTSFLHFSFVAAKELGEMLRRAGQAAELTVEIQRPGRRR